MTNEGWIPNLPLACQTLLDLLPACEQALQKSLKEISAESKWLSEVKDKNWRLVPAKSLGGRVNINRASVSTSGRRQCMHVNSKTPCTESSQQSKKVTQKSRNLVCDSKPLAFKQTLTRSSVHNDSKENRPPVRQLSDESRYRNSSRVVTKTKPYIPAVSRKAFEEKGADKRMCTSEHEAKHSINKGVHRQDSTAGKILVASTVNSAGRKDCNSKMSCEQKSSGYRLINHLQIKEPSWRNSTLKTVQLGKGKPPANTCESQVINVDCNSHASRWNKTNHLQREFGRDMHASTTSTGMAAIFNGIKNTHLHNQSLNETITVVTEVFEFTGNGQPARLKEFEIVKTKSAPVERIAKPESTTFMYTDTYSDPPSASSDQGFNDDDDCDQSTTASSEKSVALSRKNSSNHSDDIEAEVKAVTLTQSLMDRKINGALSTVTKPSKDSEIEAEQIKSALDKFIARGKESQSRTTAQKELSNKRAVAEVAKTVMRLGQRQNGNENFSKTTSTNKPSAEEKALIQKPKYCSNLDRNSMALQKHKQQMLTVKTRAQESLKKAAEMRTQQIEKQKKLRDEKKAKEAVVKEFETVRDNEGKTTINKSLETRLTGTEKVWEKCKDDQNKEKHSNVQKYPETEANKKEEFRKEREQLLEQEGKNMVHEELTERNGKHLTTEQNTHRLEGNVVDFKEQLKEDRLRMKQAKEEKEREREQKRIEKEKQIAFERAEQLRIEREKKEERDRKIKEEFEKLKAMEKERLQHKQKIQIQQPQKTQPAKVSSEHKRSSMQKPARASIVKTAAALGNMNNSNTNNSNLNSYVMTPVKKNSISSKSSDADNYGLDDKCSDESTDDEEDPKKKIPEWATGIALNTALITQFFKPPDLEEIFHMSRIEPPNLTLVFPGRRKLRYNYRTSSANWNSPPLKQH